MPKLILIILLTVIILTSCAKQLPAPPKVKKPTQKELALAKALTLSHTMHYSLAKTYEELRIEGYTAEEATYAINNANIDWCENARIRATVLVKNPEINVRNALRFEGFIETEIDYALNKLDEAAVIEETNEDE